VIGPWLTAIGSLLLLAAYAMHDADRQMQHAGRHIRHIPVRTRGGRHR
jgi:hypothetical protein